MSRILSSFAIKVKPAFSPGEGFELLSKQTFDVIFIDSRDADIASSIVWGIRESKLNHQAFVMVISEEREVLKAAFVLGVRLSMPRPKTVEQGTRCIKSAYVFILQQRRRSIRFETSIHTQLHRKGGRHLDGQITNVSETGIGLKLGDGSMVKDEFASVDLKLPGTSSTIRAAGRVVWSAEGRAGLTFLQFPNHDRGILQDWIAEQIRLKNSTHPMLMARLPQSAMRQTATPVTPSWQD